jgi:hypothetical protein
MISKAFFPSLKRLRVCFSVAAVAGLSTSILAQEAPAIHVGSMQITGVPEDWSTHHMVYSNPGTEQDSIQAGRHDQWQRIVNDPRYVIQQLKRNAPVQGPAAVDANYRAQWLSENSRGRGTASAKPEGLAPAGGFADHSTHPIRIGVTQNRSKSGGINTDWNESVGTATSSTAINFPAKWSFSTNAAPSCSGDFVVYATGQAGSSTQASIIAYYNLYSECGGTVPQVDWAYNTGGAVSLAPVFSLNGKQVAFMQTTGSGSITATTNGNNITAVTSGTFTTNEVGSVVTGTGVPAGDTIASVNATSNTATLTTAVTTNEASVTLTVTGVSQLVLLTFAATGSGTGTLASPTSPTLEAAGSAYYNSGSGCAAPCMFASTLSGAAADTWSNPYYDYSGDALYVGDSVGKLHKFSPVFRGAPAEVGSPWPVQMASSAGTDSNQLATPVYDSMSGNVFVGSTTMTSATTGGYFYAVKSSSGAIQGYSSTQLDKLYGIRDAPLFDPVAEKAYVFAGYNSSNNSAVSQFSATGFSGSTAPLATATLGGGAGSDQAYIFAGAFDNTYFTSASESSPTGYLYACGTAQTDTLAQIAITSGTMSTTVKTGPELDNSGTYYPRCSPITEFYNTNAVETPATTASGSVSIATNPSGWSNTSPDSYPTVTIGGTTYTFVSPTTTPALNQVQLYNAGGNSTNNQNRTAQNLNAVISLSTCYGGGTGCYNASQAANTSVTSTFSASTVSLTSRTSGAGGNFTLSTNVGGNAGAVTVSGGNNGVNAVTGVDYLSVSVFASTESGCTNNVADGCVMSFDVTTPSSWGTGSAPLATLNVASPGLNTITTNNPAASTTGIIVDNDGTSGGQSEIYFLTQDNSASAACVTGGADGICAIQAAQSGP